MSRKRNQKQKKQIANAGANFDNSFRSALASNYSGAGTCSDMGASYQAQPLPSQQFRLQRAHNLYQSTWEGRKIIDIPVADILRHGWTYEYKDESTAKTLDNADQQYKMLQKLEQALRVERIEGGSAILLGVSDYKADPSKPLNVADIGKGDLQFLHVIPRNRISVQNICTDPFDPCYGSPLLYTINGQTVHRSRLIIFDGNPLLNGVQTYSTNSTNDGFGFGKLDCLHDDIMQARGTRQAAFQLVNKTGMFFISTDLMSALSSNEGEAKIGMMQDIMMQLSAYKGALMHTDASSPTTLDSISPNFAAVPELIDKYLGVLSAGSDIPATRFLGQAPGGLNATGDSDLENYYGRLMSEQQQKLKPAILQYLEVMGRSVFGAAFDSTDIDVTFEPLWTLSDTEMATIESTKRTSYGQLVAAGVLTDDEAVSEMIRDGVLSDDLQRVDYDDYLESE
jgi:phage-related protein (TIGR01555 family)